MIEPAPTVEPTGLTAEMAARGAGSATPLAATRERSQWTPASLVASYGVLLVLGVLFAGFCLWMPDTFATWGNVRTMVNSQAVLLILALTATVALRAGDFDLSIAAVMSTSASAAAVLSANHGRSVVLIIPIALAIGLAVGALNAFLVVKVGVDAFIVTLGVMTSLAGLCYWITDSRIIGGVPSDVTALSRTVVAGFPLSTWYGWFLAVVLWYVYERTPAGRYMLFVGGSRDSARLTGLNVDRIRIVVFMASATMASLCGIVLAGQLGAMDPSISGQYLLQPFAAAFMGATVIKVGRFNAIGTVVGLYLLVVGITGLQLRGVDHWVSSLFNGLALVAAVTVARLAQRREAAGRANPQAAVG